MAGSGPRRFGALTALALCAAGLARGEPLRLELVGEVGFTAAELSALLQAEAGADEWPTPSARILQVEPAADDDQSLDVVLLRADRREVGRERVDLRQLPSSGRPRALALAVAELLRRHPPESAPGRELGGALVRSVPLSPGVDLERRDVEPPLPPWTPGSGWNLEAALGARAFPLVRGAVAEARLSLSAPLPSPGLRAGLELGFLASQAYEGAVDHTLSLPAAALSLGYLRGSPQRGLELGARLEAGPAVATRIEWSQLQGDATAGGVVNASAFAVLRLPLPRTYGNLGLGLEVGFGLVGAESRGAQQRVLAVGGPMVGLTLRTGVRLDGGARMRLE